MYIHNFKSSALSVLVLSYDPLIFNLVSAGSHTPKLIPWARPLRKFYSRVDIELQVK
jgi:hypothetical protein